VGEAMNDRRFIVLDSVQARNLLDDDYIDQDGYQSYLCERMPDGTWRELGSDMGEPEDNTFSRDWIWVVEELNKLADEVAQLQACLRITEESLRLKEELVDSYRGQWDRYRAIEMALWRLVGYVEENPPDPSKIGPLQVAYQALGLDENGKKP
jgi:hypothetical protein